MRSVLVPWQSFRPSQHQFVRRAVAFMAAIAAATILQHSTSLSRAIERPVSVVIQDGGMLSVLSVTLVVLLGLVHWRTFADLRFVPHSWGQSAFFGALAIASWIWAFLSTHVPGSEATELSLTSPAFLAVQLHIGELRTHTLLYLAIFGLPVTLALRRSALVVLLVLTAHTVLAYPLTALAVPFSRLALLTSLVVLAPFDVQWDLAQNSLTLGSYTAIVGLPCSGILSLSLLTAAFTALALLLAEQGRGILWSRAAAALAAGGLAVLLLNALRLVFLLLIGAFYSYQVATGLFHSSIGALLFLLVFAGELKWGVPFLQALPPSQSLRGRDQR